MTTDKTGPEFHIRINGITFEDAAALCGSKFKQYANNWHASEDDDGGEAETGVISIPVANIGEVMLLFGEIEGADDWAENANCWQVSLHATRIMPTYALGASLTETGCDLRMGPYKPAQQAVEEALTRLEQTIADVRAAACLLEGQP
jgi:hypothetical protein